MPSRLARKRATSGTVEKLAVPIAPNSPSPGWPGLASRAWEPWHDHLTFFRRRSGLSAARLGTYWEPDVDVDVPSTLAQNCDPLGSAFANGSGPGIPCPLQVPDELGRRYQDQGSAVHRFAAIAQVFGSRERSSAPPPPRDYATGGGEGDTP